MSKNAAQSFPGYRHSAAQRQIIDSPANDVSPAHNDNTHLGKAIGSIAKAYDDQIEAARQYRESNKALATAFSELEKSMKSYRRQLERIDVSRLNRKARRLSRIAGAWCNKAN